jgi:hypothetical protein
MTKIHVIIPEQSVKQSHDRLRRFSPNCSGKWKNIKLCDNFNDADLYVAFWCGDPILRKKCPPHSVINVIHEPSWHIPKTSELGEETITNQWVVDTHNPLMWWVEKTYSELANHPFPKKTKLVSTMTSSKYLPRKRQYRLQLLKAFDRVFPGVLHSFGKQRATGWVIPAGYRFRINFIKKFTSAYPNVLDVYGRNLGNFNLSVFNGYLGALKSKWDGLAPYRYAFAFENTSEKNYFSETLVDCILAGCMPLYWGCSNLKEFLPENSFVELDITKKNAVSKAINIIDSDYRERNLDALEKAKDLILNKYQFWPTIHEIIRKL